MIKKYKLYLSKISKIFLKKTYKINRIKNKTVHTEFKSFYYTAFAGIILIIFFTLAPKTIQLTSKLLYTPKIIENSSKLELERTWEGKILKLKPKEKEQKTASLKDLFYDIFDFDNVPTNTVRLSAATLEQLFKDTNYNLKQVRKNKIVKPVSIDLLPNEIKSIESTKKRKQLFIQIVLPLILEENNRIELDRKRLFAILNKNNNSKSEKNWLKAKFKQYGVVNRDLTTLKVRMDVIPVSLAIAQAAKETGWGTSRFALEGNALFGQWTFSGVGLKPKGADSDKTHKVMKFRVLQASVKAYQRNLNTHSSYKKFRKLRAQSRDNDEKLDSLILADCLDQYAATGVEYTKTLKKIILQNSLKDFDEVKLLPTSKKLKNLI